MAVFGLWYYLVGLSLVRLINWHFCCASHDPSPFLTKVLLPDLSSGYKLNMTEVQAMVEFSVELNKFYNVDLFQRGYAFYNKNLITDFI